MTNEASIRLSSPVLAYPNGFQRFKLGKLPDEMAQKNPFSNETIRPSRSRKGFSARHQLRAQGRNGYCRRRSNWVSDGSFYERNGDARSRFRTKQELH